MGRLKPQAAEQEHSDAPTPARTDSTIEKDNITIDDSPVSYLTWRSFMLGIVVSMGGFIFGYSTGRLQSWASRELRAVSDIPQVKSLVSLL